MILPQGFILINRPKQHEAGTDLRRGFAQVLQASLVHGSRQNDIAVVTHDMGIGVVQLEGLGSRVLVLNGPLADSSPGLLEALRQPTTASKDVHGMQSNAIILCMSPTQATSAGRFLLFPSFVLCST